MIINGSYRYIEKEAQKEYYSRTLQAGDLKDDNVVIITLSNQSSVSANDVKYDYELPEGSEILSNNCSGTLNSNASCSLIIRYPEDQLLEDINFKAVYDNDSKINLVVPTGEEPDVDSPSVP